MAYVGHDDPQYLYTEYVAALLEMQQAHREYCASSWADTVTARRYWWAARDCAASYRSKLRYDWHGRPRDLSTLNQWKFRVPRGD